MAPRGETIKISLENNRDAEKECRLTRFDSIQTTHFT